MDDVYKSEVWGDVLPIANEKVFYGKDIEDDAAWMFTPYSEPDVDINKESSTLNKRVAIDFDGTLHKFYTSLFPVISLLVDKGWTWSLLTGRQISEYNYVLSFLLNKNLIKGLDAVFLYPCLYGDIDKMDSNAKEELDYRIADWKAMIIDKYNFSVLIDDNEVYCKKVINRNPNVSVFRVEGLRS